MQKFSSEKHIIFFRNNINPNPANLFLKNASAGASQFEI